MKTELFEFKGISYTVQIGKNAEDNWRLIDAASETDVWFHIRDTSSCHIVLKTCETIRSIPRQVIKRCAYLCRVASKLPTCEVVYTTIKNIKKAKHVGSVHLLEELKIIRV